MENNRDDDNGEDGSKLLSEPQEGDVLSILSNNPRLIRLADSMGDNVFHISGRNGDIETICKLIAFLEERQDEDLERVLMDVNVNGDTPLHLALMNGHDKVSYHLGCVNLQAIIMRNNDGISPFELAERAGYSEYPISQDISQDHIQSKAPS